MYSAAPANPVAVYGDSDFLQAVSGKDPAHVFAVMDELMDTLHIINERHIAFQEVLEKPKTKSLKAFIKRFKV